MVRKGNILLFFLTDALQLREKITISHSLKSFFSGKEKKKNSRLSYMTLKKSSPIEDFSYLISYSLISYQIWGWADSYFPMSYNSVFRDFMSIANVYVKQNKAITKVQVPWDL